MYWENLVLALLYSIQDRPDPLGHVDRVLALVVRRHAMDATPHQYADSIRRALASDAPLNDIVATGHSEELLRQFLAEMLRRIKEEFG
jgi:hypothetical protein